MLRKTALAHHAVEDRHVVERSMRTCSAVSCLRRLQLVYLLSVAMRSEVYAKHSQLAVCRETILQPGTCLLALALVANVALFLTYYARVQKRLHMLNLQQADDVQVA